MKNIIEKKTIVENKIKLSSNLREFAKRKILFRLVNNKSSKGLSYSIYENAKLSANLELAFNNDYRYIDLKYDTNTDTHTLNRKYVNVIVDIPSFLNKSNKSKYSDLLNQNDTFIKENKVSSEIIENQKYFRNLVNSL